MAGHSHAKNIMHRKGKSDAARSKVFSKLAREITVAAKMGMPDPAFNARLRLAVASSSKKEMLGKLLALVGGEDILEEKTSSDDADNSKPDPDIVEAARRRLDEPAERCVMIGDTPYDVEASRRARIRPIAFRSGGWKDVDLKGAVEVYDGPRDLLDRLEASMLTRER